jgi:cephalosporin-C deacetylase
VVAALDCRGQGGLSEDVGGVKGNTHHGHIIRGLSDEPRNMLMRHIFLDTAQLAGLVMAMPEVDETRVAAMGGSQGGALTVACASLEPRINRLAPVFPFLCDYRRVWEMDLAKDAYQSSGRGSVISTRVTSGNRPCSNSSATSICSTCPSASGERCSWPPG